MNKKTEKKAIKRNIRKFTNKLIKKAWKIRIDWVPYILAVSLTIILILILIISMPSNNILKQIIYSLLAACIFFIIIQLFYFIIKEIKKDHLTNVYEKCFLKQGIEEIFENRNKTNIEKEYNNRIKKAITRVWAFGMTNRNFFRTNSPNGSQFDKIIERMEIEALDVVIGFWNPKADMYINDYKLDNIINIQSQLETECESKNIDLATIDSNKEKIKESFDKKKHKGRIRIVNITLPSNFSGFLIDDEVFFYPFLSKESSDTSIILSSITRGTGNELYYHFKNLIENKRFQEKGFIKIDWDSNDAQN